MLISSYAALFQGNPNKYGNVYFGTGITTRSAVNDGDSELRCILVELKSAEEKAEEANPAAPPAAPRL